MIVYIEHPEKCTQKKLELINESNNIAEYRVNIKIMVNIR